MSNKKLITNSRVPNINGKHLSISDIHEINTQMYNNRRTFMGLFDEYGNYSYQDLQGLIVQIESGIVKKSVYEMSVIRILVDMSNDRGDNFPDKIANIFMNTLQFLSGDLSGEIKYKTTTKDILTSYQEFIKDNKKTPKDFAIDFDNWVMFICSDPSLWNDEAFKVVKTIGDWILKVTMHHANSMKHEKLNLLMDRLKEILIERVGTQPELLKAMIVDMQSAMKEMDLLDMPQIRTIQDNNNA